MGVHFLMHLCCVHSINLVSKHQQLTHLLEGIIQTSRVFQRLQLCAVAVQLYTHREDVDLVNSHQLAALPSAAVRYVAQDSGSSMDLLKSACPVSLSCASHCDCLM